MHRQKEKNKIQKNFTESCKKVWPKFLKKKNIILGGDFNGRIGNHAIPECIGTYGEQVTNHNGAALRDFCAFNKLKITN